MALLDDFFLQPPSSSAILGAILFLLVFYLICSGSIFNKLKNEPPGPRPLPFLGNLLQLDHNMPTRTLCKMSKKFGSVFTFYFGSKKVVVLAGYKTIKQALVNHKEFGTKVTTPILKDLDLTHGIVFSNGDTWKEMRRFALTNLRDFGMGKRSIEEKIQEECQHVIEVFKDKAGKAFSTNRPLSYAASNIICSIIYGRRFQYDDSEFTSMVARANENNKLLGSPSVKLYNQFPKLCKWISDRKRLMENAAINRHHMKQLIKGLGETLNPQMCRGFVDSFLIHVKHLEEYGAVNTHFHQDNLLISVVNLFAAGTDTTASTLQWALLYLAKYPRIQDQVQEELSRVIGSRQVRLEDRKNLPYTDAVIHETQRLANVVPFLEHSASQDVFFNGYFIKKGTPVLMLLLSIHQDENEWESPHTFNPNHFLDNESRFVKPDAFMPFSAGQRACIGEGLAKVELFLLFISLLQHFRFTPPPGVAEDELDTSPVNGLTLRPSTHQLCAVSRL